jgi:hypothetical protein
LRVLQTAMAAPTSNLGKAGRAIVMRNPGSTDVLHLEKEWYTAAPAPGEILVHTVSTSVNPVDTYQRSGKYRLQFFPKARAWRVVRCDAKRATRCDAQMRSKNAGEREWRPVLRRARRRAGAGQRRGGPGGDGARGRQGAPRQHFPKGVVLAAC